MKFSCGLFLFLICGSVGAQPRLVLLKKNNVIARFAEGDRIHFQRKDLSFRSGIITGIHPDFIKLGEDDTTFVRQIKQIDLRGVSNTSFHTASSGRKLIWAGVIFLLIDLFNGDSAQLDSGVATVSAVFIGSGIFLQFVNNNYFKIGPKKKVAVLG